jgi:hypothetical protein
VISVTPCSALPPGKEPPVPTEKEAGWAPELVWTKRLEQINFPLRGINPSPSTTHVSKSSYNHSSVNIFIENLHTFNYTEF